MARARAVDAVIVWALSIVLAALFLLAGLPKLLGMETIGLQAVAMEGFPSWVRVLAGILQVIGAICLLFPPIATIAAVALALLMIPAAATQYISHPSALWVPIVLFVLLLFVAWRRSAERVSESYHDFAARPHPLLREGVVAGLIGAVVIAVWFLIVDAIAGRPLYTPTILGRGLLSVFGPIAESDSAIGFVFLYTIFHFAAFILVGLLAALVVHTARREPSILFGFIILFVAAEIGIHALVELLDVATPLGSHAWLLIMVGNLLAAAAMGYYFWRRHGELGEQFRHSLDWESVRGGDAGAAVAGGPRPAGTR
ncbi:MAG TPA: DoxX family protein, partial [Gemmatimonadaceae bacterium]|nr:DoxX family protein [Gemmatimonadaceae bacterium]